MVISSSPHLLISSSPRAYVEVHGRPTSVSFLDRPQLQPSHTHRSEPIDRIKQPVTSLQPKHLDWLDLKKSSAKGSFLTLNYCLGYNNNVQIQERSKIVIN